VTTTYTYTLGKANFTPYTQVRKTATVLRNHFREYEALSSPARMSSQLPEIERLLCPRHGTYSPEPCNMDIDGRFELTQVGSHAISYFNPRLKFLRSTLLYGLEKSNFQTNLTEQITWLIGLYHTFKSKSTKGPGKLLKQTSRKSQPFNFLQKDFR